MDRSLVLKADIAHVLEHLAGTDAGCNDGGRLGRRELSAMKQMGQEARLNYIVEELKKDSVSFRDMEGKAPGPAQGHAFPYEYPYARATACWIPGDSG